MGCRKIIFKIAVHKKLKIIIPASIWVGSITEITNSMSVLSSEKNRMAKQKNISWKKFECLWTNFERTLDELWTNFERTLNELWTNFERTFQAISKQSYFCFISFISLTRKTGLDISYLVGTRDGFSLSFPWDWICFVFFTEFLSFWMKCSSSAHMSSWESCIVVWNNDN